MPHMQRGKKQGLMMAIKHYFEVYLKYMTLWLHEGHRTRILAIIEAPGVPGRKGFH